MTLAPARLQGGWLNPNRLGSGPRWSIYQPQDANARAYIAAVEAADGQPLESTVRLAIDNLIAGIKADYTNLGGFNPRGRLAAPRTISGCMVPVTGTAPTNVSFVAGDLNRQTGLLGDGTTKYIVSNVAGNANAQNNQSAFAWVSAAPSISAQRSYIGSGILTGGTAIVSSSGTTTLNSYSQAGTLAGTAGQGTTTGFKGVSRSASASYTLRTGGNSSVITQTSETPTSNGFAVFARNSGAPATISDARIAAFGIGSAMTQSLLEARLQTYLSALAAAGI